MNVNKLKQDLRNEGWDVENFSRDQLALVYDVMVYTEKQLEAKNRDTSNPKDLIFNPVCNCHGSGVNSFSGHCDRCGLPKKPKMIQR